MQVSLQMLVPPKNAEGMAKAGEALAHKLLGIIAARPGKANGAGGSED